MNEQQSAAIIQLVTLLGGAAKNAYDHWQQARDLALQSGITEADLDEGDARFLKEYIPKPPNTSAIADSLVPPVDPVLPRGVPGGEPR